MSLQNAGVWAGGVWASTVWGQDVWYESAAAASTTKGGYAPIVYRDSNRRPKDHSILEHVQELVNKLDQAPITPPKKVLERIDKVVQRADKAVNLQNVAQQRKEIRNTLNQIERLETVLTKHIRESQEDEDAAIQALMRYM